MKSYTDIEQSRKLAEILPLESADGGWYGTTNQKAPNTNFWLGTKYSKNAVCPAWSLAALLDVLPNNEHITTSVSRGSWQIEPINYLPNTWWCEYEDNESLTEFNVSAENPVDACVDMILKLKRGNLL